MSPESIRTKLIYFPWRILFTIELHSLIDSSFLIFSCRLYVFDFSCLQVTETNSRQNKKDEAFDWADYDTSGATEPPNAMKGTWALPGVSPVRSHRCSLAWPSSQDSCFYFPTLSHPWNKILIDVVLVRHTLWIDKLLAWGQGYIVLA